MVTPAQAGLRPLERKGGGDLLLVVELRGFEPLTPCMPLMRGWFTTPCNTSRIHITAQLRDAAEGWVVGRREAMCSAVSGKYLARTLHGRLAQERPRHHPAGMGKGH